MSGAPSASNIPLDSADIAVTSPEVAQQLADTATLPWPSPQGSHTRTIPTASAAKSPNKPRDFGPGRAKKRSQGVQVRPADESEVDDAAEDVDEESDEGPEENQSPQGVDSGPPPSRKGRRPRKKFFGLPKDRNARGFDPLDYEQKYPPDPIYEEAQPNSRVWRMCLDEFQIFDSDLAEDARDTVDVLLVFAGLFSAVVTAFLIQTADKLEPDYVQLSSSILYEILVVQRAFVNGSAVDRDPVVSSPDVLDFSPPHSQLWINGLWYTSLSLSLITALVAVLAKQWLHQYMSMTSGTPLHRSLLRQFRYEGLQAWRVPLIIGLLPVLMHLSLGIFFIGLILFLAQLYPASAYVVGLFALIAYSGYFASHILSAAYPQCPYKTPLSDQLYVLLRPLLHPKPSTAPDKSIKEAETRIVAKLQNNRYFSVDVLQWVFVNSTNPSARRIVLQSFGGFPLHFHDRLNEIFKAKPIGIQTVSEFHQSLMPLVSVLESPPSDPLDAQNAYMLLERLVRAAKYVLKSDRGLLWEYLPTHPPVPLELVAAIASHPTYMHGQPMKLQAKEVFSNPNYLSANPDLRLHPQTWIDLVDRILNPTPRLISPDDIRSGSLVLLPIIQLCGNSPSVLDVYNTKEFQLYLDGHRAFPVPFDEPAVTFRRVCQVPAFREMVDENLYRLFNTFDRFTWGRAQLYRHFGLNVRLAFVKYYQHVAHGGCSSADPVVVSELGRLVSTMLRELSPRKHFSDPEDWSEGYTFYLVCQDLLAASSLPNDPKHLKLNDKPRHSALIFVSCFLEQAAAFSYIQTFSEYRSQEWFSMSLLKDLILLRLEEIGDRTDAYDYIAPGTLLLERGLFQRVPAAYDVFVNADLLRVLTPFRYYPTVSGAVCYYVQSTFYWVSIPSEGRPQWCLPFVEDAIPDIDTHKKYFYQRENVFHICIIFLSAPEDSFGALLGQYASPRTRIIEFLGLFWLKGEMEITWLECRAMLRTASNDSFDIALYPVFRDHNPSVLPTPEEVDEMVRYLVDGIDLLDKYITNRS